MKKLCISVFFIVSAALLFSLSCEGTVPSATQLKRQMDSHLAFIRDVFESKYAPMEWKQKYAGFILDKELNLARERVQKLKDPSIKDFRFILKDFFNSTKDYHVSVRFFSTEKATLPFLVKSVEGRYFVSYVNKSLLPFLAHDLNVGDELLQFNKRPIGVVVQEVKAKELGDNTKETDQALAEIVLTNRDGASGHEVPSGPIEIQVRKKSSGEVKTYLLKWDYFPEQIRDFSKVGRPQTEVFSVKAFEGSQDHGATLWESGLFDKPMLCPWWEKPLAEYDVNPHLIGSRTSFLPALGVKKWESNHYDIFHAYIFEHEGRKIGYVRIPHYVGDDIDLEEFTEIIALFEQQTDALVIDQLNNPGGSLFYLYGLVSLLTDRPLASPKHRLALTQEDINMAVTWLPIVETIRDDESARQILGETFDGYPVDYQFAKLIKEFFHFVLGEWNGGNLFTKPTFIFGVDEIQPHPHVRYTKPILLLINSLCMSGGDFFPAIMQDGKRATLMGTRTSGAGGYVVRTHFPNLLGIKGFHLTGSIAQRIDQKSLENLGVTPDILYSPTVNDVQNNYSDFAGQILNTLSTLR